MVDVYVSEEKMYGMGFYVYTVMVDGKPYDQFDSKTSITWSQQWDVAAGYRDALTLSLAPAA